MINLATIAARYEKAQCAHYGHPADWDVDNPGSSWYVHRLPRPVSQHMSYALCADCPLLAQCARDALEDKPVGVIRAGVYVSGSRRPYPWQRAVWRAVAAGGSLQRALEALSPQWEPGWSTKWVLDHMPWSERDLAALPPRARNAGGYPTPPATARVPGALGVPGVRGAA